MEVDVRRSLLVTCLISLTDSSHAGSLGFLSTSVHGGRVPQQPWSVVPPPTGRRLVTRNRPHQHGASGSLSLTLFPLTPAKTSASFRQQLFHKNPWSDPSPTCTPFQSFRQDPKGFLAGKFPGMGEEVATYLAERVLAWDPEDRVTAGEFGKWVGGLITMLGGNKRGPGVFLNGGIGGKQAFKGGVLQFGKVGVQRKDSTTKEDELVFAKSPVLARRSLVPIEGSDAGSVP